MTCHRCGLRALEEARAFRAVCACGAWLHCCRSCGLYQPGAHNDCREPQAERVADKEAQNFCEWFQPAGVVAPAGGDAQADARAALARLFGKKP